jgi:hypothetical protein
MCNVHHWHYLGYSSELIFAGVWCQAVHRAGRGEHVGLINYLALLPKRCIGNLMDFGLTMLLNDVEMKRNVQDIDKRVS